MSFPKADRIIRSRRKSIALEITPDARLIVRAPVSIKDAEIDSILRDKRRWIETKIGQVREKLKGFAPTRYNSAEIKELKHRALALFEERTAAYASCHGFRYKSISLSNASKRWGSCSSLGSLRFNWRLVLAPAEVTDYVIVHELCHLKEQNHSRRFWKRVEEILPDYRERNQWLKQNRYLLAVGS